MGASDATNAAPTRDSRPTTKSITPAPGATLSDASLVRIVDGDTIIVRIGGSDERVRLIGINTPELNKPDGPVECYAIEASDQTEALIGDAGGHIQLERDVSETDQYGRLLRYVWLVTPQGKQLLNEELVEGGYARSISYRPDVKYQSALNRDQTDARNDGRGLWGACG
jgi:micrococcal nuclease